jgi:diacylglycerol kinase (ATP)
MSTFDGITIIFNPNSTGDAPDMARRLQGDLAERLPGVPTNLIETQHAGHAEELARGAAAATARPLVVSVSGDGGYHEVVNGVMAAGNPEAAAAVHAAGNANDHRSATREQPLIDAIVAGDTTRIDLLKAEYAGATRYAHSYLGLGITPDVATELNKHELTKLKEIQLVLATVRDYQPFRLRTPEGVQELDSLICANIPRMAKVLKLSQDGDPSDGLFELVVVPHASKPELALTALRLATAGPADPVQLSRYEFTAVQQMAMQLDGELQELPADTTVTVTAAKHALLTVL